MTGNDLLAFRRRMGWSRKRLAAELGISPSRIGDYEVGHSRGRSPQPAPIPKTVDLACRYLSGAGTIGEGLARLAGDSSLSLEQAIHRLIASDGSARTTSSPSKGALVPSDAAVDRESEGRAPPASPAEAAERLLELRRETALPPGETIRSMIEFGRA